MGGPVERDRGFVLHTDDYVSPDSSLPVIPGVSLTATREVLEAIAGHNRRPRRSLLALGYAGWGAGQLEQEIQRQHLAHLRRRREPDLRRRPRAQMAARPGQDRRLGRAAVEPGGTGLVLPLRLHRRGAVGVAFVEVDLGLLRRQRRRHSRSPGRSRSRARAGRGP